MENEKFKQIIGVVEALHKEMSPLYKEIGELNKAISQLNEDGEGNKNPLNKLIVRLTKTARRHDISKKIAIKNNRRGTIDVVVGTNHQGLGYQYNYSSQLSPLFPEKQYHSDEDAEQKIRDILFDEDAVIELTSIIKKSNQKTFLKTIKILKKYGLVEAFDYFKEGNIQKIVVPLQDTDYKIVVNLEREYETIFKVVNDNDEEIAIVGIDNDNGKPNPTFRNEDDILFKKISKNRYGHTNLNNIKTMFLISQHSDAIIKGVQEKTKLLNSVIKGYKDEHKELNELLQPLLALEKL